MVLLVGLQLQTLLWVLRGMNGLVNLFASCEQLSGVRAGYVSTCHFTTAGMDYLLSMLEKRILRLGISLNLMLNNVHGLVYITSRQYCDIALST